MNRNNVPICIIRPFSVTGVGEQKEHLIPTLIRAALYGEKMDFVKEPVHDFIDVQDVARGMVNLAINQARGIFELGTGKGTSNQEVLELVEKITKKHINAHPVSSMRPYDNAGWVSTNFKSRSYGWLPKKSLEDSIKEMVKAYEN
jgi:nucleoside-diphosphate-sugar epimerase